MNLAEILKTVSPYAKTRDGLFSILMAGGVWLAGEIRHTVGDVQNELSAIREAAARLEMRVASLEKNR